MFVDFALASNMTEKDLKNTAKFFNQLYTAMHDVSLLHICLVFVTLAQILWEWSGKKGSLLVTCIGSSLLMDSSFITAIANVSHFNVFSFVLILLALCIVNIPIIRGLDFLLCYVYRKISY